MRRFSVLALTLLVLFASVLPSVLARETNAERLRRGEPPLPPTRREAEKRHQPSTHARDVIDDLPSPSPRALREAEKRHQPSPKPRDTNADRLRRGYPPLPPTRREVEKRSHPSSKPREVEKRHQPSPKPRDTNADRLKRGYPPLPPTRREVEKRSHPSSKPREVERRSHPSSKPREVEGRSHPSPKPKRSQPSPHPTRRETEKRHQPSQKPRDSNVGLFKRNYPLVTPQRTAAAPPQTVSGVLEIRDHSGARQVGFVENQQCHFPLIGVTHPSAAKTDRLEATFSGDAHTVVADSAFLGPDFFPDLTDPNAPPEDILITSALDSFNLPQPNGRTVPAVFVWDKFQNALLLVTDWPAYQATAAKSGPLFDREPELVRLFLVDPN
ncbi:hypothetical protein BC826DRAFT_1108507 [Russula brevipes]|nr:hypothetical protein BC826DRAFT_1108507 [Russula brevipes]